MDRPATKQSNLDQLMAYDPWHWAYWSGIQLQKGPFALDGFEWLPGILRTSKKNKCYKKASQMAGTEGEVISALHGCITRKFPLGVLYLFPSKDSVTDFSASRFKPLISANYDAIGKHVLDTDRANLKRIGNGFLYFRSGSLSTQIQGQHKTSKMLVGIPVDSVVYDEWDLMSPAARDLAIKRMEQSNIQSESFLSNPTLPDYGIEKVYAESDMSVWMIRCSKCGKYTCLELEYPECLHRLSNGKVIRLCMRCRDREVYPRDGRWEARHPDRKMAGFWISHLCNYRTAFRNGTDPAYILDMLETPPKESHKVTHFWNMDMGMGYASVRDRLTYQQVLDLCGDEGIANKNSGPCSMGVDQGNDLHVVIGKKSPNLAGRIVHIRAYRDWNELDNLMRYFKVSRCVVDALPETRNARAFAKRFPGKVYLNYYNEHQKGSYAWNEKETIVSCNRTESLDNSHREIMDEDLILPKQCEMTEEFARHMSNVAKRLEEDAETGSKRYVYVKLGPDHLRHAFNYETMARGTLSDRLFPEFGKNNLATS